MVILGSNTSILSLDARSSWPIISCHVMMDPVSAYVAMQSLVRGQIEEGGAEFSSFFSKLIQLGPLFEEWCCLMGWPLVVGLLRFNVFQSPKKPKRSQMTDHKPRTMNNGTSHFHSL